MLLTLPAVGAGALQATPTPGACLDAVSQGHASPAPNREERPAAMPPLEAPGNVDHWYIAMMIPHHQSIIAMAQAALPRLSDDRLLAIAASIVETQQEEIGRLAALQSVEAQEEAPHAGHDADADASPQPHLTHRAEATANMAMLMDAAALVDAFCSEPNADLAFVDLAIPHHQMAIDASRMVLAQGADPLVREIARTVIAEQQREIEELTAIGGDLAALATPASATAQP